MTTAVASCVFSCPPSASDYTCYPPKATSKYAIFVSVPGAGITAFLTGPLVSIPFMNSALYEGSLARRLSGADIAYSIGILVAGIVCLALHRVASTHRIPFAPRYEHALYCTG